MHNINVAQRIFIMFYNFDLPSSSSFVATNKCDNSLKILGVIRSDYAAGLAGAVTYCDIQKPQLLSPISFWTTYPGVFFDFKSENVVSTGFYLKYFVGKYWNNADKNMDSIFQRRQFFEFESIISSPCHCLFGLIPYVYNTCKFWYQYRGCLQLCSKSDFLVSVLGQEYMKTSSKLEPITYWKYNL